MMRAMSVTKLARQFSQLGLYGTRALSQNTMVTRSSNNNTNNADAVESWNSQVDNHKQHHLPEANFGALPRPQIGENVSRRDKIEFLVSTLNDLNDKEAIYSALDAWVAWEKNFPIGPLKNALVGLEKEAQWHKIIQIIKWMLSKGQGNTMGTYKQLIHALDMDHRAKEAHEFWTRKIGYEFHSVPWGLCSLMISIYYRNNMLQDLVKLFKGLEAFDRKPPEKSIVQKVADAYEMLGLPEEKDKVLAKYKVLFTEKSEKSKSSSAQRVLFTEKSEKWKGSSARKKRQYKKKRSKKNVEDDQ